MPWKFWVIVIAVVACALYPLKAKAALNFKNDTPNGPVGLRLSEAPCTNPKVLAQIKAEFHHLFKAAVLTYGGRDWHSCWTEIEMPDQHGKLHQTIISIDEEGSPFQPIPKKLFRDDSI